MKQWQHNGFMQHVKEVKMFYQRNRDIMLQAIDTHLKGQYKGQIILQRYIRVRNRRFVVSSSIWTVSRVLRGKYNKGA